MKDKEPESVVKEWLDEIKPVPPRDPHMASRGRAQFLGEAVSAHELPRHRGWITIFGKEHHAMNIVLSILVIAGLLFGGGATVKAAQDDLPNEPLYAMKIWTEDLSLQFQASQENKVDRLMELAQTRIHEMTQLTKAGQPVPDRVRLRLEQHIQQALQLCVNMDDPALEQALLQIRDRLRQQDRVMEQLQLQTQEQLQLQTQDQLRLQTENQLQQQSQTRTMLHERLQLVEEGLSNREMFRNEVQNQFQFGQDDEVTPPAQNGNGQQNGGSNTDPGGNSNDNGSGNGGPNDNGSGSGGSNNNGSGGGGKP